MSTRPPSFPSSIWFSAPRSLRLRLSRLLTAKEIRNLRLDTEQLRRAGWRHAFNHYAMVRS